jgi:ParE toxin of type II toxin-antitoxin system, parDE
MAVTSAARFTSDQDGMHAINVAVAALAGDPEPPEAFIRGEYHRLRVGPYRVMYAVDDDVITVERVDRLDSD